MSLSIKKFLSLVLGAFIITGCSFPYSGNTTISCLEREFSNEEIIQRDLEGGEKYLFLLYFDGDNNLNDYMYSNLMNLAQGVCDIKDTEGKPREGYKDVKVIALLDGSDEEDNEYKVDHTQLLEIVNKGEVTTDSSSFSLDLLKSSYTSDGRDIEKTAWYVLMKLTKNAAMSRKENLQGFIEWAVANYPDYPNIILQIGAHGEGPKGSATRSIKSDYPELVQDLYSDEIGEVFKACFSNNKLDLLLMDSCYSASIEETYEFSSYVKTLIGCPDTIPGSGHNYRNIMRFFTSDMNLVNLGVNITESFIERFMSTYNTNISFIDLAYIKECKEKISLISEYLLDCDNKEEYDFFCNLLNQDTLRYKSTFSYLHDIGYLALSLRKETKDKELQDLCSSLIDSLEEAIIASWKFYDKRGLGYYASILDTRNYFGLTISGSSIEGSNVYKTNMSFAQENKWVELLKSIYPSQF